jgi:hypothetical protein
MKQKRETELTKLRITLEKGEYVPAFTFAGKNRIQCNFGGKVFNCNQKELSKGVFG